MKYRAYGEYKDSGVEWLGIFRQNGRYQELSFFLY